MSDPHKEPWINKKRPDNRSALLAWLGRMKQTFARLRREWIERKEKQARTDQDLFWRSCRQQKKTPWVYSRRPGLRMSLAATLRRAVDIAFPRPVFATGVVMPEDVKQDLVCNLLRRCKAGDHDNQHPVRVVILYIWSLPKKYLSAITTATNGERREAMVAALRPTIRMAASASASLEERVRALIDKLPVELRPVIHDLLYQGRLVGELAEQEGVPKGVLKRRLGRAVRLLAAMLRADGL